jgi:hypothetical protein
VKIFTYNFHPRFFSHDFSATIHKKHPCTAGEFWRSGLFTDSDRFSENRLASKIQSGLEGKKSSPQAFMRQPYFRRFSAHESLAGWHFFRNFLPFCFIYQP